ncbi:MAG: glucosamine-6-phosphate deaminase [Clostridiaceae bacterium]|jgi:glucosamine-6-phosphate deaminase|nr:glucosamine-6-phosphate deaminase [Bacillota bacterium]NLN51442.1 glucosamine-6-phosphate deaminase [Clostridiaceae bacterium]
MRIIVAKDYAEMSKRAADIIASQIRINAHTVLGLATGSTPVGAYEELVRQYNEEGLNFGNVDTFNLDEYIGLGADHPQSYRYFMDEHLLSHINMDADRAHVPDGLAQNPEQECEEYDRLIRDLGGVDLQLLGMGGNGHIGFNEPNDIYTAETHVVNLTESTIKANSIYFNNENEVPRQAITMGFRTIMQAKKVIFVVSGKAKSKVVKEALEGPITPKLPASILQLHHDVIVVLDQDAASEMKLKDNFIMTDDQLFR